jgi:acyl-CoA reductase-like NAD-dependent aldehyde dehydrogenase
MKQTAAFPFVSGKILLDGVWQETAERRPVINPASNKEIVGEVAYASERQVQTAINVAERAFSSWSQSAANDRVRRMLEAAEKVEQIVEEHVSLYVRENGKVLREAKKDIQRCLDVMRTASQLLPEWWQPEERSTARQQVQIRRRPRGVTAIITPWNSPVLLTFKRVIPAVLAGNTVIVKPASHCPLTVMSLLREVAAHFPPGVINILTGSGSMIGHHLSTDPRVRALSFVGGTETGKTIMAESAGTLTKLYMELGGNDPALLLPDVELNAQALQRLRGGILRAAGQVCSAIKRIYVHESRYDELVSKLTDEFQRVIVGNGLIPDVNMGPLNNEQQFHFVRDLIEQTKKAGREVISTGRALDPESWNEGYFLLPHIVTDALPDDPLVQCEQFGPVIPIIRYQDIEEALSWANHSPYGLRASVWTTDEEQAQTLADRLQAGAVFHNNHTVFTDLRLDFPGLKESGVSRETTWLNFDLFTDSYGFAN